MRSGLHREAPGKTTDALDVICSRAAGIKLGMRSISSTILNSSRCFSFFPNLREWKYPLRLFSPSLSQKPSHRPSNEGISGVGYGTPVTSFSFDIQQTKGVRPSPSGSLRRFNPILLPAK